MKKVKIEEPKAECLEALCLYILLFCVLTSFLLVGCGKRRPPQPPIENVPQRTELLSGVQRGNSILLSWPAPRRNASDENVQSIRRADVYRLAEGVDDPLPLTEEEFSSRATLIGSVPFEQISKAQDTIEYTDELSLKDPIRLRYAVRYVNASNQRAAFSNFLLLEPASSVSQPPVLSNSPEVSQTAILLHWDVPTSNVDNTEPANLLGYNIYRAARAQNEHAQTPLNARPVTSTSFADQTFSFGEEYIYVVRAVSLGTGGEPVESLNSNSVIVKPSDTFAPTAPKGLNVAASLAPLRVSIFFAVNPERDVAGYNIYRSEDPNLPKDQWIKLNRTLLARTTFQDDGVQSGKRYFYFVRAIDNSGNTSDPSEVASDVIP